MKSPREASPPKTGRVRGESLAQPGLGDLSPADVPTPHLQLGKTLQVSENLKGLAPAQFSSAHRSDDLSFTPRGPPPSSVFINWGVSGGCPASSCVLMGMARVTSILRQAAQTTLSLVPLAVDQTPFLETSSHEPAVQSTLSYTRFLVVARYGTNVLFTVR